jgi:hypothetical protein
MTDRDPQLPLEFDDLEPLPPGSELPELPEEAVLEELPEPDAEPPPAPRPAPVTPRVPATPIAARPATPSVPGQTVAPSPAPAPQASPVAVAGAPLKPGAVSASTGSRRERMEKDREERKSRTKIDHWVRWTGAGEKPRREMEKAPALLRKAAWGLYLGCLLPWGGVTADWGGNVVEKLLVLAGLYVWHQAHLLRDGVKVPGFIAKLGAEKFLPLFVLAGLLALVGFLPILSSGSLFLEGGGVNVSGFGAFAEKGFLLLAGLTLTHIYDYQHGGRFNPLYPIMFLAPGIAGLMALMKVFSADPLGPGHLAGGLGAVLVGIAGWMSAYTMYVAMKEAKAHGDAKKAAQVEARKTARTQRSK